MFDFFDEDFPLSKKQEEEEKKRLAEEKAAEEAETTTEETEIAEVEQPAETQVEPAAEVAAEESDIDFGDVQVEEPDEDEEPADAYETDSYGVYDSEIVENFEGDVETAVEILSEDVENTVDEIDTAAEEVAETAVEEVETAVNSVFSEPYGLEGVVWTDYSKAPEKVSETTPETVEDVEETIAIIEETVTEAAEEVAETVAETVETVSEPEYIAEEISEDEVHTDLADETVGSYDEWGTYDDAAEQSEDVAAEPVAEEIASIDEIEAHLHEELKSLGEKLDSMEKVVDEMEDGELPEGFDYEYDERYFAEEETPAYKHPELYGKSPEPEKPATSKPKHQIVPTKKASAHVDITIDAKTVAKAGVAVAAAALAVAIFRKKK